MTKISFVIEGNKVQNVGYRLFLLNGMKDHEVAGYAHNLPDGIRISVQAWGKKNKLQEFYNFLAMNKPKSMADIVMGKERIEKSEPPLRQDIMHEKMDLIIEQTGKFVQSGLKIEKKLGTMPKEIAKELKPVLSKYAGKKST